jgi:hypothetical protein
VLTDRPTTAAVSSTLNRLERLAGLEPGGQSRAQSAQLRVELRQ